MRVTRRRTFLVHSGRAALGLSFLPLASCSRSQPEPSEASAPDASLDADALVTLVIDLEAQMPSLLAVARVPGLSIALVHDARVVWSRGFGVMQSSARTPVDLDTIFEVGSISKTVFAYAVMKLCEKGLLDLDKPLTSYVPERWLEGDTRVDQMTARHVLSHTGGFQNWRSTKDPLRIHFAPGARHMYSGEGYSYLQLVVAHLTGQVSTRACETMFDGLKVCATDIDTYLKTNVLHPFGMVSSGYVWEERFSKRIAGPHDQQGQPISRPRATPILAARYGAAGGLSTTATEYARFLIEVLDPKPADSYRLALASRDEMLRPQVKLNDSSSWALGWQVLHQKTGDLISHGGDNPGYKAFMLASVARKSGYVIMTNGDNGTEVIGKLANGDTPLNKFVSG